MLIYVELPEHVVLVLQLFAAICEVGLKSCMQLLPRRLPFFGSDRLPPPFPLERIPSVVHAGNEEAGMLRPNLGIGLGGHCPLTCAE